VGRSKVTICVREATSASACDAISIRVTNPAGRYDGTWFMDEINVGSTDMPLFDIRNGVITNRDTGGFTGTVGSDGNVVISVSGALDSTDCDRATSRCWVVSPFSIQAHFTSTGGPTGLGQVTSEVVPVTSTLTSYPGCGCHTQQWTTNITLTGDRFSKTPGAGQP